MIVIFCADPMQARQPDPSYAGEAAAVMAQGLPSALLDYEALTDQHDAVRAVRRMAAQPAETIGVYRGWMITPPVYAQLFAALLAHNIRLINDSEAYQHCHYLPDSLDIIGLRTPATVWLRTGSDREVDMGRVMELLRPFGARNSERFR